MDDIKDKLTDFISTSFDELADNDVPVFKQIKSVFNVVSAGKGVIDASHDTRFEEFLAVIKNDLKRLARYPRTDTNHLRLLMIKLKELMISCGYDQLELFIDENALEKKLRETEGIPSESVLPKEVAHIIRDNIARIVSPEDWHKKTFEKLDDLSSVTKENIERFDKKLEWLDKRLYQLQQEMLDEGTFQEYLENKLLPQHFIHRQNRFHYLNKNIRFHGRIMEITQIERFLFCEQEVAVWAICGQGGVGKSKFVRNICERNQYFFNVVWLEKDDFTKINGITKGYKCDKPVLFVCDYADEKEKDVIELIKKMRDAQVKSRFLLLVRQKEMYEKCERYAVIKEHHYYYLDGDKITPLDLSRKEYDIKLDTYKEIIEDFRAAYYSDKTLKEEDYQNILDLANKISPNNSQNQSASRCLFILLITDAILSGADKTKMDYNELLQSYFKRNQSHVEGECIDNGMHLLALATALNGLDISDSGLPEFINEDINAINSVYTNKEKRADFLNKLSDGYFDKETNILYPIEPDIIGEFVFLWQFFDCIFDEKQEKWLDYLSERFDDENDDYFTNFLIRCQANWKDKGEKLSSMINQRWEEQQDET